MGKFLKNVISNDNENKSKKKIENIVFLIIILIATLIIINIIWKDEKEPSDTRKYFRDNKKCRKSKCTNKLL